MNGKFYDLLVNRLERDHLAQARLDLLTPLEGRILDVGAGTGANFPFFQSPELVVAIEPDPKMRQIAQTKAPPHLELLDCAADNIPLASGSIDHVVCTLVLCSIGNLDASLNELYRVLKPGGSLTFLEHVKGEGCLGILHDSLTPLWSKVTGGCHLNRDTPALLYKHGFTVESHPVCRYFGIPFVAGRAQRRD